MNFHTVSQLAGRRSLCLGTFPRRPDNKSQSYWAGDTYVTCDDVVVVGWWYISTI
jgi:hypothetical protein